MSIEVRADGSEAPFVLLKSVEIDENAERSLISANRAEDTKARRIPAEGGRYTSKIKLRWWQQGKNISFAEEFYVVKDCGAGADAVLRGSLQGKFQSETPTRTRPLRAQTLNQGEALVHIREIPSKSKVPGRNSC
jgi:hypothetical protein